MPAYYGIDISIHRTDDLDRLLLQNIASRIKPTVLELGCGRGGLTTQLVAAGAHVFAVDIIDYTNDLEDVLKTKKATFSAIDMRTLPADYLSRIYDACVIQRSLHYLPQPEAVALLTQIRMCTQGALYVSVTGIDTEIARHYPTNDVSISNRWSKLDKVGQEVFSISAPVCFYKQMELRDALMAAGWQIEKLWTSAFGNHKAVCV